MPAPPPPPILPSAGGPPQGAVIDADFLVVLEQADSWPKPPRPCERAATAPLALRGMDALEPEPAPSARPFGRRGGWGFWLGGLCLASASFWTAGGHAWLLPAGDRGEQNEPTLTLAFLGSETQTASGRPVLHVEAEARNRETRTLPLPPLSILVTTGKGAAMRYRVAAPPDGIGPRGRQRFSTMLPVPADGVRAVSVAFAQ